MGHPRNLGDWTVATNGHMAVIVQGDIGAPKLEGEGAVIQNIRDMARLDEADITDGVVISLKKLRQWAGQPHWTANCKICKGTGKVDCQECDHRGEVACECSCGDIHDRPCDCEGKKVPCEQCGRPEVNEGLLAGRHINRVLLAQALSAVGPLVNGYITLVPDSTSPNVLLFHGAGYRILVMPMRSVSHNAPVFPLPGPGL